jgi:hypothetical protein
MIWKPPHLTTIRRQPRQFSLNNIYNKNIKVFFFFFIISVNNIHQLSSICSITILDIVNSENKNTMRISSEASMRYHVDLWKHFYKIPPIILKKILCIYLFWICLRNFGHTSWKIKYRSSIDMKFFKSLGIKFHTWTSKLNSKAKEKKTGKAMVTTGYSTMQYGFRWLISH